jgi:hypothetical protein
VSPSSGILYSYFSLLVFDNMCRADWFNDDALDLYPISSRFKSRPGHRLSQIRDFYDFS